MIIEASFDNEIKLIEKDLFVDERGWFIQSYDNSVEKLIGNKFVQENVSFSNKNVFRGLHYQWAEPMGKLVQCLNGNIIDVVVDIRKKSKSLGQVKYFNLDKPNKLLWIPQGFAHGFYSTKDNSIVKYMCTSFYNKNADGVVSFMDENFEITKILNLNLDKLIISDKDKKAQSFEEYLKHPKF